MGHYDVALGPIGLELTEEFVVDKTNQRHNALVQERVFEPLVMLFHITLLS